MPEGGFHLLFDGIEQAFKRSHILGQVLLFSSVVRNPISKIFKFDLIHRTSKCSYWPQHDVTWEILQKEKKCVKCTLEEESFCMEVKTLKSHAYICSDSAIGYFVEF